VKPVSGVITLADNIIYKIAGMINISPNVIIKGKAAGVDGIVTSSVNPLFSGINGLKLHDCTIVNMSGPLLDLTGTRTSKDIIIANSPAIGTVADLDTIILRNLIVRNMADGLVIDSAITNIFIVNNFVQNCTGSFTWLTFASTFTGTHFRIGRCSVNLAAGQTGLNISTSISTTNAYVKDSSFNGGTALTGISQDDPRVSFQDNDGIVSSRPIAAGGYQGNTTQATIITTTSSYVPIGNGNVSHPNFVLNPLTEWFQLTGSNQIEYLGFKTVKVVLIYKIAYQRVGSVNSNWNIKVQKNGSDVFGSSMDLTLNQKDQRLVLFYCSVTVISYSS